MKPQKRKPSKKLSIKTQFKEGLAYIKESKKYIYVSIAIFLLATLAGFVFSSHLTFIDKYLAELIAKTENFNTAEMIFFILQNNLQSSFFSILFGVFFGIFPLFSTVMNGLVMGYVLARTLEVASIAIWWRLLPHGIFELPAIFISFGLGIKLGLSILTKKNKSKEFKRRFYNSINSFFMIIIPLLIIAAAIEGILISIVG